MVFCFAKRGLIPAHAGRKLAAAVDEQAAVDQEEAPASEDLAEEEPIGVDLEQETTGEEDHREGFTGGSRLGAQSSGLAAGSGSPASR